MASAIGTQAPARNDSPAPKQRVAAKENLEAKPKGNENEKVKEPAPESKEVAQAPSKNDDSTVSRVA
jgi:hypothetical protein